MFITNKDLDAAAVVNYHEGRGSQEGIFGERKSQCHLDYIPVKTRCGNETHLLAGLFVFNIMREWQMQTQPPVRKTTGQRMILWAFK